MRQRANEDKNKRSRAKSLSPKKSAPMSMSNSEYSLLDTSIDSSIDSSKQKSSSISNLLQKIPFSKKIITPFYSSSKHRKNSNNRSNFLTSPVFVVVSAIISSSLLICYLVFQSSTSFQTDALSFPHYFSAPKPIETTSYPSKNALLQSKKAHTIKAQIVSNEPLLKKLATFDINEFWTGNLKPLLIERVAGTDGLKQAEAHILSKLPSFYNIEMDVFKNPTPYGDVEFRNIIASSNPKAERQLVLSCHHDSKYWPNKNEVFIGATDSSVPCAMLLQAAQSLGELVLKSKDLGLTLMFFDGEEAFVDWTATDSVYGSRHITKTWSENVTHTDGRTRLDGIDTLVLLDLLGVENPFFRHDKKFKEVNDFFLRFAKLERKFKVKKYFKNKKTNYFHDRDPGLYSLGIDDDHMPFYRKGVKRIVHLIPVPFPKVWHKISDNESALDKDTIYNLQILLNCWTAEYLGVVGLD